ncbi:MAG: cysteine synthase [Acidobacteriaceae bacterium]|nr:cysteine synthase [Acidobacteriaceae bacterium]
MQFDSLLAMVGKTPALRIVTPSTAAEVYLKLEGANPTGSLKDRACLFMYKHAIETGRLTKGKMVLAASSGNFGCSVAAFGRVLGFPTTIAVNSKLTAEKRGYLRYFEANIVEVGDLTIHGTEHCQHLESAHPEEYCFLDQLNDWQNPQSHFETTGPELIASFPQLGTVVGSIGSGGCLLGVARFLKQHKPSIRVIGVKSTAGWRIPGIGAFDEPCGDYVSPFILEAQGKGLFDEVVPVERPVCERVLRDAAAYGLFAGLQTGGVLHVASAIATKSAPGEVVVGISGDSGWKNLDTLLKLA